MFSRSRTLESEISIRTRSLRVVGPMAFTTCTRSCNTNTRSRREIILRCCADATVGGCPSQRCVMLCTASHTSAERVTQLGYKASCMGILIDSIDIATTLPRWKTHRKYRTNFSFISLIYVYSWLRNTQFNLPMRQSFPFVVFKSSK